PKLGEVARSDGGVCRIHPTKHGGVCRGYYAIKTPPSYQKIHGKLVEFSVDSYWYSVAIRMD
ncbi:MAG: hypothetical protein LUD00_02180, partial [Prevotellaceae bacterium]|nr:hypothetical protein [Prevotellaceae bacterium]